MLVVSRFPKYRLQIWSGASRFVRTLGGGEAQEIVLPPFFAEFETKRLTEFQRRSASRLLGLESYGDDLMRLPHSVDLENPMYKTGTTAHAQPYANDGIIVAGPGGTDNGQPYIAYDPRFHLSAFDTEQHIDYPSIHARTPEERAEAKAFCEERFIEMKGDGGAYVILSEATLLPPWPGYLKYKGDSAATVDKLIGFIREAEYNALVVLEYEENTLNRPKVTAALRELAAEQKAQGAAIEAVRDQLQASVP